MPIFGLPYDDNERRRRIAEQALGTGAFPRDALTPGINPNAPSNIPMPRRALPFGSDDTPVAPPPMLPRPNVPLATPPITPREAPLPEFRPAPITRAEELGGSKAEYMARTPGRFKSGLVNALRGFAGGLATGDGLGAGLGGALAGGAFGAINPRGAREMEFERFEKPQIMERFAFEDADRAARTAAEKALREEQMQRAQIQNINSQIESRAAQDALNQSKFDLEQDEPLVLNPSQTVLDRRTRRPVFTALPDPRQGAMTADEAVAALTAEEGTVEEQSKGSLEGRREMLKKHLTPDERRIIEGRTTRDDAPETIARAHAKWQKIQDDEFQSIRRDTGERRKAKISQRRFGRKGQSGRTAISVSEAADLLR